MDYTEDRNKIIELLRERLSDEKFIHSLSTEERAIELAEKLGADGIKTGQKFEEVDDVGLKDLIEKKQKDSEK